MELDPFLAAEQAQASAPAAAPAAPSAGDVDDLIGAGDSDPPPPTPPSAEDPVFFGFDGRREEALRNGGGTGGGTVDDAPSRPATTAAPLPPASSSSGAPPKSLSDKANEELAVLLMTRRLSQDEVSSLQSVLRENASLRDKISKLKSLLGRSAKAQRDAKNDLERVKRDLEESNARADALERRAEALASRPTHMDLLADFETNFDRALLSFGGTATTRPGDRVQSGGEDPSSGDTDGSGGGSGAAAALPVPYEGGDETTAPPLSSRPRDSLLLTELNESKSRVAHLESLNAALLQRAAHLERTAESLSTDRDRDRNSLTNMQLELRMARMETDHAARDARDKDASLSEMQLEIDLVTMSAAEANRRAAEGMEVARTARRDGEYVGGLEAKVVALQEWALASTEAKRLTSERARVLEVRMRELEAEAVAARERGGDVSGGDGPFGDGGGSVGVGVDRTPSAAMLPVQSSSNSVGGASADHERKLWTRTASLVVGAGMSGHVVLELGQVQLESYESVVLRWKFDVTPGDMDIYFSVLKGMHVEKKKQRGADACFRNRHVLGGGGGDVSGAFAVQNVCTLVWSNEMSWVRPRTIKWTVEAIAVE